MSRYLVTFTVKTEGRQIGYMFLTERNSQKEALAAASAAWYSKREEEGYHKMYFKKAVALKGEAEHLFANYQNHEFYRSLSSY